MSIPMSSMYSVFNITLPEFICIFYCLYVNRNTIFSQIGHFEFFPFYISPVCGGGALSFRVVISRMVCLFKAVIC